MVRLCPLWPTTVGQAQTRCDCDPLGGSGLASIVWEGGCLVLELLSSTRTWSPDAAERSTLEQDLQTVVHRLRRDVEPARQIRRTKAPRGQSRSKGQLENVIPTEKLGLT